MGQPFFIAHDINNWHLHLAGALSLVNLKKFTESEKKMNNNLKHLSFEEYFRNDWRKHFQEEITVQNILDAAGLSNSHDFVQINSRYLIDDNRIAVIALIKRKNTEVLDKLIIDVIAGNSTFEQVYDVVYNTGSDCDYRVIICDWNSKKKAPGLWMTDNIMSALINRFDHHLFLYWISADAIRDVDGTMKVIYTVIESVAKSNNFLGMPDRRDLEYAELSLYTWQASGYFSSQDEICLIFHNYYEDENSWAEWTDENIITKVNLDQDDYISLYVNPSDDIKQDHCSYEYDKENQILIITEVIPFQNFKYSLPDDKYYLADNFYHSARIGSWIDNLLGEKSIEETDENQSIAAGSSNMFSPKTISYTDKDEDFRETEPIIYPSVLEFLGPNWKEYFLNPETIKGIIKAVNDQNIFNAYYRKSQRRGTSDFTNDEMVYDFLEVDSITQFGTDRERIIATMLDIESGLSEKWSIDISSTAPQLDQIFYALYNADDGCTKKIILYFKDYKNSNEPDIEVKVENEAIEEILYNISSYSDSMYIVWATVTESHDNKNEFKILCITGLTSFKRERRPSRPVLEGKILESYYYKFIIELKDSKTSLPKLVTDLDYPYSKIPFEAWPEWTEKGLFMRLYARHDCPETNWLYKFKMNELAKRYQGCDIQIDIKPRTHYCILVQLHASPVTDFIESSTLAKFNYAQNIRRQQMDMIRHIEEIFRDYMPEAKLISE